MKDIRIEFREQFKTRTKQFALRVIKLYQALPKTGEAQVLGRQFWLELLTEAGIVNAEKLQPLIQKATEILKMVASARKKAAKS